MKKQLLFITLVIFTSSSVFAQKESWNWYFGNKAGVNFSSGSPVALTNGALDTHEGVATISDTSGNLLFYTDGKKVYNSTHVAMANGTGLLGDASSSQSGIIAKMPGSDSLYYVFTIDALPGHYGLRYSIIDISQNSGLGAVTVKNILVRADALEKVTAARHDNGTDFWILINDWTNDDIYAYHLSSAGLDTTPVISNVGPLHLGAMDNTRGCMKVNRQNNKIAMALTGLHTFVVLDFDDATGMCSNKVLIQGTSTTMPEAYGVEFSTDGTKLYGTTIDSPNLVMQFDLNAGSGAAMLAGKITLDSINGANGPCSLPEAFFGALQLGPDGKIYVSMPCDSFLNVISNPDLSGTACGYVSHAVPLGGKTCDLGLPNIFSDYIIPFDAVNENANEPIDFTMYPNPSSDYLVISLRGITKPEKTSYTICDLFGNVVLKSTMADLVAKIKLDNLSNGVYLIKVSSEYRFSAKKLLVIH